MLAQKNITHSTFKGRIALQATAFNGDEYLAQKCQLQKHNSDCALCRKSDNSEINAAQHVRVPNTKQECLLSSELPLCSRVWRS